MEYVTRPAAKPLGAGLAVSGLMTLLSRSRLATGAVARDREGLAVQLVVEALHHT